MSIQDYAHLKNIEHNHKDGWGSTTALWVLVAAVIIFAIVYNWTKNCNEKVQFATGLANLNGRIECMEPDVKWLGKQMYGVAQTAAGVVTGVADIKDNVTALGRTVYQFPVDSLTAQMIAAGRAPSCGGCGRRNNREFEQVQTYNLASTGVTVTEKCGNDCC